MSDARFQHGPVQIMDEIVCESMPDLQVWRSAETPQTSKETHEVVFDGLTALKFSRSVGDASGKPPLRIEVAEGVELIPYYQAISPSDSLGDAAMFACSLSMSPSFSLDVVAAELAQWAQRNSIGEMIVDGVLWSAEGDLDQFVSKWRRILGQ